MSLSPANSSGCGYPLALAGAVAPTRFVGGTTSGAPVAGTFEVGDFVVTQDGGIEICTVAGSPGTWVAVTGGGGGGELAYAETTSDLGVTQTVEASAQTLVSAGAVTFDGATAVVISVYAARVATGGTSGAAIVVNLWQDSTDLGRLAYVATVANASAIVPMFASRRLTPAAGSKTYSARAWRVTANGIIAAASPYLPAYIRIVEA